MNDVNIVMSVRVRMMQIFPNISSCLKICKVTVSRNNILLEIWNPRGQNLKEMWKLSEKHILWLAFPKVHLFQKRL